MIMMAPVKSQIKKNLIKALKPRKMKGASREVRIRAMDIDQNVPGDNEVSGYFDYDIATKKRGAKRATVVEWFGWEFRCKKGKNDMVRSCKLTGKSKEEPVSQRGTL